MEIKNLLPAQKVDVLKAIKESGWKPDDFTASIEDSSYSEDSISTFRRGDYFFSFDNFGERMWSAFKPGEKKAVEESFFYDWKDQLKTFIAWLNNVRINEEAEKDPSLQSRSDSSEESSPVPTEDRENLRKVIQKTIEQIPEFLPKLVPQFERLSPPLYVTPLLKLRRSFRDVPDEVLQSLTVNDLDEWLAWARTLRALTGEILERISDAPLVGEILPENSYSQNEIERWNKAISKLYRESYSRITVEVTANVTRQINASEQIREIEDLLSSAKREKAELDRIAAAIREQGQKSTIAKEAQRFENEASRHRTSSWFWLSATVIFAVITLLFGAATYNAAVTSVYSGMRLIDLTTFQTLQLVTSKVFIFSLFLGGIVWSGKVYRSHRHNFVVNRHRSNALGCFEVFVTSTEDPQIRNAVLMHAAQCIFTPQNTGYISNESDSAGLSQIVEIVKDLPKGGK